jgi:hypothetical protein
MAFAEEIHSFEQCVAAVSSKATDMLAWSDGTAGEGKP